MALPNLIPKSFRRVSLKKTESNRVFPSPSVTALFLFLSLLTSGHSQKLQVIQVSDPVEDFKVSPPAGDYGKKQLDIIWNITYSAEVKIDLFDINFQAGEFVIVCEYPLPNDYRLKDGAPAEDALALLPVQNSLLLTSNIVPDKPVQDEDDDSDGDGDEVVQRPLTVRINSIYGGFIYFHGVSDVIAVGTSDKLSVDPRSAASDISGSSSANNTDSDVESVSAQESANVTIPTDAKGDVEITGNNVAANGDEVELKGKALPTPLALSFDGFNMVVQYLELDPAPITTTTTERLTTPPSGEDIYLYKYVIGKSPSDFYDGLTEFKEVMAEMGNHYCEDISNKCDLKRDIESNNVTDDIRLDKNTIFFCDRRSEFSNTCVEIKMAIPIRNKQDEYVMTTPRLEVMWETYAGEYLKKIAAGSNATLKPYKPPMDPPITTWIWVAAILGVILLLVAITVTSLLTTICERRLSRDKPSERPILPGDKESPPSTQGRKNLIMKVMDDLRKGMQEAEYHGMGPVEHEVATRTKESFNQSHGYGQYGQSPGFDNFTFNQDEGFQDYRGGSSGSDGPPNLQNNQSPFPAITRPYNNNQRTNQNGTRDLSRSSPSHHTFEAQIHHAVDDDSDEEEIYNQRRPRQ